MANALANLFTDIADSIRSKTGSTEKLSPSDFPSQIDNISVGGGGAEGCAMVTFMNGNTELLTRPVYIGDDCPDPLTQGRIETPTKESTAQYNYTYKGWSEALTNITEDKVIYATFTETVRKYTVTFYDTDGTTVLYTQQVAYGGSSTYTYKKDNHIFLGWTPEPTNITADLECVGAWQESYSFADASWEYIAQMSESGQASQVFAIGDERTESDRTYVIADFNYDILADDNSKTAGITIITKEVDRTSGVYSKSMYGSNWLGSGTYKQLNGTILKYMPTALKSVIKPVQKKYRNTNDSTGEIFTSNESLWLLSCGEIGKTGGAGYDLLERSQDRAYKLFDDQNYIKCSQYWWTRSVKLNDDEYAIGYKNSPSLTSATSTNSYYPRFGFCI